ncbi:MAG: ribokinase [Pseudomonadota bacterium]
MPNAAVPCAVIGSYNHDLLFRTPTLPGPGETCLGSATPAHGGKGFNQSVAAVRLGVSTHFVGAVGDDVFAADVGEFAAAEGIEAHWLVVADTPTGLASVTVDDAGANQIVVASGANAHLDAGTVLQVLDAIGDAVVVCQLEVPPATSAAALEWAHNRGQPGILDPAPVVADFTLEQLRLARIITPNEHEFGDLARRFLGLNVADDLAHADDQVLHQWCRRLGVDTVVLTIGKSGCFVSHDDESSLRPASPFYRVPGIPVAPIDTTGAGDCFTGALAAALIHRPDDFPRACRFANRAASIAVTRSGAAPAMPRLAELAEH